MTRPFSIDIGWAALLDTLGVRPADLLRTAKLPEDLFTRPRPILEAPDYFRLWDALADAMSSDTPALTLGQAVTPEVFSPPLFAAFCSPNMRVASTRLSHYKPLIGPCTLDARMTSEGLELTFDGAPGMTLPKDYLLTELVFLVHLPRIATRDHIVPVSVQMTDPPTHPDYEKFFGRRVMSGPANRVVFSTTDADQPFLSANTALFQAFEPQLQTRLDALTREASFSDRLRSVLADF